MTSLNERIRKGEAAITRAKARGQDVTAWEEHLGKLKALVHVTSSDKTVADVTEGRIVAVEICSEVLEAHIWLAFRDDFMPAEGEPVAVFYADELLLLKNKTAEQLREIHKVKVVFGPTSRMQKVSEAGVRYNVRKIGGNKMQKEKTNKMTEDPMPNPFAELRHYVENSSDREFLAKPHDEVVRVACAARDEDNDEVYWLLAKYQTRKSRLIKLGEMPELLPSEKKLVQIYKYWLRECLESRFIPFTTQTHGSEWRTTHYAQRRMNEIAEMLDPKCDLDAAWEEVVADFKETKGLDEETWRIFWKGSNEDWVAWFAREIEPHLR